MTLQCDHRVNELHVKKTFSVAVATISMPSLIRTHVVIPHSQVVPMLYHTGSCTPVPSPPQDNKEGAKWWGGAAGQGFFASMVHRSLAITKPAGTISY